MNKILLGVIFLSVILFGSCSTRKIVLLKDMVPNESYAMQEIKPLKVKKGDRISIVVSAKNQELAIPFNMSSTYQITDNGNIEGIKEQVNAVQQGYLVSQMGTIDFPILGALEVENYSLVEVKEMIAKKLKEQKYINDPMVKVELLNLRINIMGEVVRIGLLEVPSGQINLLEALSRAGGITRNAATDKIAVVREQNGVRRMILNDIESKDLYQSEAFQLQQNDFVYVIPKDKTPSPKQENSMRIYSIIIGLIGLGMTAISIAK